MKIAVDGHDLTSRPTGVGRYLLNLLKEILKIDRLNHYTLYLKEDVPLAAMGLDLKKAVIPSAGGYSYWQNFVLVKAMKERGCDFLFAPANQLPVLFKGESALVVHDVAWRARSHDFSFKERIGKDWKCRWSLRHAQKIFTDAEFTRLELARYYRVKADKVHAIHLGIEDSFKRENPDRIEQFKKKNNLFAAKTVGFLGSMFKRRHIPELIKAVALVRKKIAVQLFLVGKNHSGADLLKITPAEGIIWQEWLNEDQLNAFYSSLDLFVFLSEYEGFGFPPLESLQCGTVPLLLRSSSLQETCNDTALFVESHDPETIAAAILNYFADEAALKEKILTSWIDKKAYFSWPRVAQDYMRILFK
jgi:glycosyltransferase involved in cell wall biosynthesis